MMLLLVVLLMCMIDGDIDVVCCVVIDVSDVLPAYDVVMMSLLLRTVMVLCMMLLCLMMVLLLTMSM